ncbi:hypothetical protein CEXT_799641 [Caerostris extrusa]|uniref:Uncharacterized protein n=1 Tax=Caerostris extrusa TaxID=172846 RepID=A0AAV4M4G1_CAEEX|nr:hypothetical protein CEXT_799641 [Caerostris extrusa]
MSTEITESSAEGEELKDCHPLHVSDYSSTKGPPTALHKGDYAKQINLPPPETSLKALRISPDFFPPQSQRQIYLLSTKSFCPEYNEYGINKFTAAFNEFWSISCACESVSDVALWDFNQGSPLLTPAFAPCHISPTWEIPFPLS